MGLEKQVAILAAELSDCKDLFIALGDEVRQHLIIEMIRMNQYEGVRVGELAQRASLSRSAVSHHLQILKDAGIVSMRRIGTRNYYYFNAYDSLEHMIRVMKQVQEIEKHVPKPENEEW